jgi:hypothetical protein
MKPESYKPDISILGGQRLPSSPTLWHTLPNESAVSAGLNGHVPVRLEKRFLISQLSTFKLRRKCLPLSSASS